MGVFKRGQSARQKGAWTPAPYPAPAPQVPEPAPASDLKSAVASLSGRDRGIAGAILAAVAVVGIGIGYALPGGFTDEPVSQTVAELTEPASQLDSESPLPAPAPIAELAPSAPADTGLVPNVDPEPAPAPVPDPAPAPEPIVEPAPAPAPAPQPEPVAPPAAVYYPNCTAVRAAGADPIYAGQPGYGTHLDRDQDGIACDVTG